MMTSAVGSIFYSCPWSNSLYKITNDTIYHAYQIDFGSAGIPEEKLNKYRNKYSSAKDKIQASNEFNAEFSRAGYCYGPVHSFDFSNMTCLVFSQGTGTPQCIFISKTSGKTIVSVKHVNDMQLGYALKYTFPFAKQNDNMVGIIYPKYFLSESESIRSQRTQEEWDYEMKVYPRYAKLIKDLSLDDNPVLLISKMKDF
jgi:hypothetical protein